MKVLVTGGAGFIGSHVADALLLAGHEVVVFDDLSTGRRENVPEGAVFVHGDLRAESDVDRLFAEHTPHWVSHQGAQTSVAKSTRDPLQDAAVNVMGTLHVLRAAVRHRVDRLVFASTGGAIYGEVPEGERAAVGWVPRPMSPYACSKLAGEAYLGAFAAEFELPTQVLRYANVYGPRQDPHGEAGVVAIFGQRLLSGEPLRINARAEVGDAGCVRDYVYVGDVVAANLAGLRGQLGAPIVNVGTGEEATTRQVAEGLGEALGVTPEFTYGGRREGDLERSLLEPGTGPDLVSLDEGLRKTASWFAERHRGE